MSFEELKKNIQLAKKAVEDEPEPYKTEAFKIVLEKLLDTASAFETEVTQDRIINVERKPPNLTSTKDELAAKCNITITELDDAISIKDDTIEIIAPLTGVESDAQKHLIITQCVLAAYEVVLGKEWVPTSVLTECLKSSGVKDLANFAPNLKKQPMLFRSKGVKRSMQYRLTSGEGRQSAFNIIHRLAKGEFSGNKQS